MMKWPTSWARLKRSSSAGSVPSRKINPLPANAIRQACSSRSPSSVQTCSFAPTKRRASDRCNFGTSKRLRATPQNVRFEFRAAALLPGGLPKVLSESLNPEFDHKLLFLLLSFCLRGSLPGLSAAFGGVSLSRAPSGNPRRRRQLAG